MGDSGLMMKISMFIIISLVLQGAMFGDEIWDESFDRPSQASSGSAWDSISNIGSSIWGFLTFVWKMLSFDIPEIPWMVRIMILVPVWAGLLYLLAPLLIALLHAIAEIIPF